MPDIRPDGADGASAEARLLERCRSGSREAFDELMQRYERRVYNLAYRLSGNYDEAMDIAADSFVRIYNSLGNFRGDSSFLTWLYRVVTNIFLDHRKRQRARPSQSLDELIEQDDSSLRQQQIADGPTPEEHVAAGERTSVILAAIESLPDYQRAMVVLYHMEDQSYEEIAAAFGLPIGTVKSRLNRARLALKQKLGPIREQYGL